MYFYVLMEIIEKWKVKNKMRISDIFYCIISEKARTHKKLRVVYENEALKERQCQNWFAKFQLKKNIEICFIY